MPKGDQTVTIAALLEARGFLTGLNRVVRGLQSIGTAAKRVTSVTAKIFTAPLAAVGRLSRSLFSLRGLLLGLASLSAVNVFANFEAGITQVSTLVDTAEVNISRLADGVLEIGTKTGDSFDSLNQALFDTVSAGVAAGDALRFLDISAKLAAGGGTTTGEAVKGVVALINAYGLEAKNAEEVSDALFKAMQGGITTVGLLSSNVGKVAPVARQAGLSLDEMLAAVSALTKGGLSTEEAVTGLRATLQTLIRPNEEAKAAAKALKIEWDAQALQAKGLIGVLQQLSQTAVKPTVQQMAALAGSSKAFVGVASLAADRSKNFRDILSSMADKAGATDEAFKKVANTTQFKIRVLQNTFQKLFIVVGEAAKPFLDNTINALTKGIDSLTKRRAEFAGFFAFVGSVVQQFGALVGDIIQADQIPEALSAALDATRGVLIAFFKNFAPSVLNAGLEIGKILGTAIIDGALDSLGENVQSALQAGGVRGFLASLIAPDDLKDLDDAQKKLERLKKEAFGVRFQIGGASRIEGIEREIAETEALVDKLVTAISGDDTDPLADRIRKSTADITESFVGGFDNFRKEAGSAVAKALEDSDLSEGIKGGFENLIANAEAAKAAAIKSVEIEDFRRRVEPFLKFFNRISFGLQNLGRGNTPAGPAQVIEDFTEDILESTADQEAAVKTAEELAAEAAERLRRAYDNASALSGAAPASALFTSAEQVNEALANAGAVGFNIGASLVDAFGLAIQTESEDGTIVAKLRSLTEIIDANLVGLAVDVFSNIQTSIAGILEDAFTGDFDNITERFRQFAVGFLRDFASFVARIITQALALQFVKALLPGLFNEGGKVEGGGGGGGGLGSLLGLNSGGGVPGPNVNRDVVPALLTPGEFVLNRDATRYYGEQSLEAMNRRLVPRAALDDLRRTVRVNLSRRFASGGSVSSQGAQSGGATPTIVADNQTLSRLLAGGKSAMQRFVAENPDTFRALSGASRR